MGQPRAEAGLLDATPAPALFLAGTFLNLAATAANTDLYRFTSPVSVAWARLVVAVAVLAVTLRTSGLFTLLRRGPLGWALVWGTGVALMNASFYLAAGRLPFGAAVTLGFCGPILLAAAHSRQLVHVAWTALAAGGVLLIAHPTTDGLDPVGVALGLLSGLGWAVYIEAGRRMARSWPPRVAVVVGTAIAALTLAPVAALAGGFPVDEPVALLVVLIGGTVGTVLPYVIDMRVMRRIHARTFSVLQSSYPAGGVLVGLVLLGQLPSGAEAAGIALVTAASIGALRGGAVA
jgi:inner membrane transporter RhtA